MRLLTVPPADDHDKRAAAPPPPMPEEERRRAEALLNVVDTVIANLTDETDKLQRARDSYRRRLEGR